MITGGNTTHARNVSAVPGKTEKAAGAEQSESAAAGGSDRGSGARALANRNPSEPAAIHGELRRNRGEKGNTGSRRAKSIRARGGMRGV
jgi:hypothetical protein